MEDDRGSLVSWTEMGDVAELRRFIFHSSNARSDFNRDLLLYSTYDEYGSTLLQIAVKNGHTEIVELLLSHDQYSLEDQHGAMSNLPYSLEVVRRVLLLVYYLNPLSQQKLQKGGYGIDAPFVIELAEFMSQRSKAVQTAPDDYVLKFIGDPRLLASYNKDRDAQHIVLLWAFSENHSSILTELQSKFEGAFDLFNHIFSSEGESSATKDLKFFFGRLVQALKFEMLHARSRLRFDTALHTATVTQHAGMAHILLKYYDDLAHHNDGSCNFLDVYSMTPLHYAVMLRCVPLVKELLANAAYAKHVNAGDWCLRTPLHLACGCGVYEDPFAKASSLMQLQVVKMLVNDDCNNVDWNAKDCCGFTPLHWAVHIRASEVVRYLLEFKDRYGERTIRTTEKDFDGKSVLQHAMENSREAKKKQSTAAKGLPDISSREAKKKEIERLLMSQPGVKDEIDIMYRDRQVYVDAANAILVGAALIASVTYGGWLQPPAAEDDSLNLGRLQVFWFFNSMSFFSAMATVMAGAGAVLPIADVYIEQAVQRVRDWLALTSLLLVISVILVLGAFATAGFVAQSQYPNFEVNMAATTVTGSLLCSAVGVIFLRGLSRVDNVWPWTGLFTWARRVCQHSSGIAGSKVKVNCTLRDLDLRGGNVWHIHFVTLIGQMIFSDFTDRRHALHIKDLDREQLHALVESWDGLTGDFLNGKYGCRPVLPACAHVGDRGVQHSIIDMSSIIGCRQSCRDRDRILLRDIRDKKKIDIWRWVEEIEEA